MLPAGRIGTRGVAYPTDQGPAPRLQLLPLPSCFLPRFLALSALHCCGHRPRWGWGLHPLPCPHLPVQSCHREC